MHGQRDTVEIDLSRIPLADGTCYQPILWTTEHPYPYEMTVGLGEDKVSSYFGLRTIAVEQQNFDSQRNLLQEGRLCAIMLGGQRQPIYRSGTASALRQGNWAARQRFGNKAGLLKHRPGTVGPESTPWRHSSGG